MNPIAEPEPSPGAVPGVASAVNAPARYELRYPPLSQHGRGFAFPCDAQGRVVMDELSEQALNNYLYARATVGLDLGWPLVERRA
jgi:hypothetical protein